LTCQPVSLLNIAFEQSEKAKIREQQKRENGWKMSEDAKKRSLETRMARIATGEIKAYSESALRKLVESRKGSKRVYRPDGTFYYSKDTGV
jgi:hypothetical protein